MTLNRCCICKDPLPAHRNTDNFPGPQGKLCGESCLRRAIEAYWRIFGLLAIGHFVSEPKYGTAYRLDRVVVPQKDNGKGKRGQDVPPAG